MCNNNNAAECCQIGFWLLLFTCLTLSSPPLSASTAAWTFSSSKALICRFLMKIIKAYKFLSVSKHNNVVPYRYSLPTFHRIYALILIDNSAVRSELTYLFVPGFSRPYAFYTGCWCEGSNDILKFDWRYHIVGQHGRSHVDLWTMRKNPFS